MSMAELAAYNCGALAREIGAPIDLMLTPGHPSRKIVLSDDDVALNVQDPDGFTWWFQVGWTRADQIARGD